MAAAVGTPIAPKSRGFLSAAHGPVLIRTAHTADLDPATRNAARQLLYDVFDVHHHVVPPTWLNAMNLIGRSNPPLLTWSVQKTLEDMDKGAIETAILSPTAPQVIPLGKEAGVRIAREANEYGKKLMADHPGRFGVFATLPLPHIDESLKEIAYAFDTLKVDGIGMMTNYGDKWLGYSYFDPIWEELNRRRATIYTHPADANCCVNLVQGVPA